MNAIFNEEALRWFEHMLDVTIGDKPASIADYHFYVDDLKRELVKMVYEQLRQEYEQTKLTADFFGIGRKTVYRYTKSTHKS